MRNLHAVVKLRDAVYHTSTFQRAGPTVYSGYSPCAWRYWDWAYALDGDSVPCLLPGDRPRLGPTVLGAKPPG